MTTIIGFETEDGCTLAADAMTTGSDNRAYMGKGMHKIHKWAEYLLAPAGPGAMCDVVAHLWTPPVPPANAGVPFIAGNVVPSLKKSFAEYGLSFQVRDEEKVEFEMLLALQGRIYHIANDGTVLTHHRGIYGIGTGGAYAIGVLSAGESLAMAEAVAMENDVNTRGPWLEYHQKRTAGSR